MVVEGWVAWWKTRTNSTMKSWLAWQSSWQSRTGERGGKRIVVVQNRRSGMRERDRGDTKRGVEEEEEGGK